MAYLALFCACSIPPACAMVFQMAWLCLTSSHSFIHQCTMKAPILLRYESQTVRIILCMLQAHTLTVTQLAFSPDGHHLLSASRDRTFALWAKRADPPPGKLPDVCIWFNDIMCDEGVLVSLCTLQIFSDMNPKLPSGFRGVFPRVLV